MTTREMWCGDPAGHGGHGWLGGSRHCDGVSRDEAAVMAVSVENGYGVGGNVDRDDARLLIAALDEARGDA